MFMMTRPVGKMSSNKIEDVALVQAALKQIRGSNGRPLWPGAIDGKNTQRDIDSLAAAIAGFESKANLRITGTLPNSGNAFNALGRTLPTNYKDMHGIPGTNIVAGHVARKRPKPDGGASALALPEALAADLLTLMGRLEKALNYLPTVRAGGADANGHDKVTVDLGLRFLDPQGRIPGKTAPVPTVIKTVVDTAVGGSRHFKLSQRQGAQLMLASTEVTSFPASQLAAGSNAWPVFTGSVGENGRNANHDVAALQAALANIVAPGGSKPFWEGRVDGTASDALYEALSALQAAAGLDEIGTLKPGDATVKALSALLPSEFKGLRGVREMAAALVDETSVHPSTAIDVLPEPLQKALRPVAKGVEQRFGVPLLVRGQPSEAFGHVTLTVTLGDDRFVSERGRILPPFQVPPAARDALRDLLVRYAPLKLASDGPPGKLILTGPAATLATAKGANIGAKVDVVAVYGTNSFLVGRPLREPPLDRVAGHLFIVTGARYFGDADATVYSFGRTDVELSRHFLLPETEEELLGPNRELMMGRVDNDTDNDYSKGTHGADVAFWEGLASRPEGDTAGEIPPEVVPIFGDETEIRWLSENVVVSWPYDPVPLFDNTANSNSAGLAVAMRASRSGDIALPQGPGPLDYPGAENWHLVEFGAMP